MSEKKRDNNIFTKFFNEDAEDFLEKNEAESTTADQAFNDFATTNFNSIPHLVEEDKVDKDEMDAFWKTLRKFFRTGSSKKSIEQDLFPALLYAHKNTGLLQTDYPIWIADTIAIQESEVDFDFKPVLNLIEDTINLFSAEDEAKILKQQVPNIENIIRKKVGFVDSPFAALPVFIEVLDELSATIEVSGKDKETFLSDIENLKTNLPESGILVPYSQNTVYHLLAASISLYLTSHRFKLSSDIHDLTTALEDLLIIEKDKRHPEDSESSMDFANDLIDFHDLSEALPESGTELMTIEKLDHINNILKTLKDGTTKLLKQDAIIVVGDSIKNENELDWRSTFSDAAVIMAPSGKSCETAMQQFDTLMEEWSKFFAAIRISKLEIERIYSPEVHDEFFANFDWRSFSEEEMSACPLLLLLDGAGEILKKELYDFSYMLSTYRPVKMLLIKSKAGSYKTKDSLSQDQDVVFRQEIGAITIAHRDTFTIQSSTVSPAHILEGFLNGFSNFTPAVFHILDPPDKSNPKKNPTLWTSAALEGREFPCFKYDSEKGSQWGSRFEIYNNPQAKSDWPLHTLSVQYNNNNNKEAEAMEIPFTWADFAALDPGFNNHFFPVPSKYWTNDLIPVSEYLNLKQEDSYAKVPFIWMVDEQSQLQKIALSLFIALSCKERLDFWHFIQENAGVNSYHVERAVAKTREELEQETIRKIAELKEEYDKQLLSVQDEAAGDAMERLADILLDIESTPREIHPKSTGSSKTEQSNNPEIVESAPETAKELTETATEEDELSISGEPWIETPLCTTCNECTDINKRIFAYNDEKQAYIADPKGGPYVDIVRAAESCPVHIIHPGQPLNPEEVGLEELIKRAEPFN